jgi:hypothetical protein
MIAVLSGDLDLSRLWEGLNHLSWGVMSLRDKDYSLDDEIAEDIKSINIIYMWARNLLEWLL